VDIILRKWHINHSCLGFITHYIFCWATGQLLHFKVDSSTCAKSNSNVVHSWSQCILYFASIWSYLVRRKVFPIEQRLPQLAAIEINAAFLACVWLCIAGNLRTGFFANCSIAGSFILPIITQKLMQRRSNISKLQVPSFQRKIIQLHSISCSNGAAAQRNNS
jgi:multisubunit Na+/H+ antiporter MnhE subunit